MTLGIKPPSSSTPYLGCFLCACCTHTHVVTLNKINFWPLPSPPIDDHVAYPSRPPIGPSPSAGFDRDDDDGVGVGVGGNRHVIPPLHPLPSPLLPPAVRGSPDGCARRSGTARAARGGVPMPILLSDPPPNAAPPPPPPSVVSRSLSDRAGETTATARGGLRRRCRLSGCTTPCPGSRSPSSPSSPPWSAYTRAALPCTITLTLATFGPS